MNPALILLELCLRTQLYSNFWCNTFLVHQMVQQHFSGSPNGASQIAPLLTCSASQIAPPLTWGASEIAPPLLYLSGFVTLF